MFYLHFSSLHAAFFFPLNLRYTNIKFIFLNFHLSVWYVKHTDKFGTLRNLCNVSLKVVPFLSLNLITTMICINIFSTSIYIILSMYNAIFDYNYVYYIHNYEILWYFIYLFYVSEREEIYSSELKCRQHFPSIFLNMVCYPSVIHKVPCDYCCSWEPPILLLTSCVSLKQLRTNTVIHSYFS